MMGLGPSQEEEERPELTAFEDTANHREGSHQKPAMLAP